ncbi:DUF1127 domain-containing protein [Gemmobacter serpentinus]|uniref:DUF1127 domain-containing protein n=1 Tax=Gemmobacter serpentinus TaxID=2652247 RepID=UPI00124E83A5|nr:DUF1127 domain-containing protein [Gemmobacter serpentinus]
MAFVNTTRVAHQGLGERFATLVADLRKAMAQRAIYRSTVRELKSLSNRELADLGIHRSMITRMAHEAAYGK